MSQSKLRSGLSSKIIIDTAVAAKRIRDLNEKELESANVAGWNDREILFSPFFFLSLPLRFSTPRDILIPVGYFCGKLTAPAVYSTSNGFVNLPQFRLRMPVPVAIADMHDWREFRWI